MVSVVETAAAVQEDTLVVMQAQVHLLQRGREMEGVAHHSILLALRPSTGQPETDRQ